MNQYVLTSLVLIGIGIVGFLFKVFLNGLKNTIIETLLSGSLETVLKGIRQELADIKLSVQFNLTTYQQLQTRLDQGAQELNSLRDRFDKAVSSTEPIMREYEAFRREVRDFIDQHKRLHTEVTRANLGLVVNPEENHDIP